MNLGATVDSVCMKTTNVMESKTAGMAVMRRTVEAVVGTNTMYMYANTIPRAHKHWEGSVQLSRNFDLSVIDHIGQVERSPLLAFIPVTCVAS